jgi:hypothetical protein
MEEGENISKRKEEAVELLMILAFTSCLRMSSFIVRGGNVGVGGNGRIGVASNAGVQYHTVSSCYRTMADIIYSFLRRLGFEISGRVTI